MTSSGFERASLRTERKTTVAEAYIIDAVRTPITRRGGGLAEVHPADLGGHVVRALMKRMDVPAEDVDDVIFGCVDAIGTQAGDIARTSALVGGLPETVPGVTIDRQCGSSQQAVHFAAQAVMSATADLVIAGGVQNMSQYPIGCSLRAGVELVGTADPFVTSEGWLTRYGNQEITQFRGAEMLAERYGFSREDMERFALESHERSLAAIDDGLFEAEIEPLGTTDTDSCPRHTSLDQMAALKPLIPGGRVTAATSSQICDGAAALMVASESAVRRYSLAPRARVHQMTVLGSDPLVMLDGPIPATRRALELAGMGIDDIDLVEINEAFASVVLAWQKVIGVDPTKVNVTGGAIALGHPLGATGVRMMTTLLSNLERTGGRFGLQTMCEGGGQANVTIVERL
jgi:acetyl-CoA C-acetyltransferase